MIRRTHYSYTPFRFMIFYTFWVTEDFISGLLNNVNRKNTNLEIKVCVRYTRSVPQSLSVILAYAVITA